MSYIPLHVHSQYSILNAQPSLEDLVEKAKAEKMEALALTDSGNLFGAVEFFQLCQKAGIKPILGLHIHIAPSRHEKKRHSRSSPILLLAKDQTGYKNLCKLSTIGYLEGFYYKPRIDWEVLEEHKEGLICISGFLHSHLANQVLDKEQSEQITAIEKYQTLFGQNFYINIERHAEPDLTNVEEVWLQDLYKDHVQRQKKLERALLPLAEKKGIPIVATNEVRYLSSDQWKAHEVLINIQSKEPCQIIERDSMGQIKAMIPNPKRSVMHSKDYTFRSSKQMEEIFSDLPESITNTKRIAEQCNVEIDFKTRHYPSYQSSDLAEGVSADAHLKELCMQGIKTRYTEKKRAILKEKFPEQDPEHLIQKRLEYELDIVKRKGMVNYLLIVYDFIHWAKSKEIPIGPGRGSGAGSIILYLIGITDIEPLALSLFFERFINPERPSFPDIDVDICMERRQEVIDYTVEKYGSKSVAQIITFGKMKAKMAIKDVGRVLSVPLSKVNRITKLIGDDLNVTLRSALDRDQELKGLYEGDKEVKEMFDIALSLEGAVRNTGIHAAGVIICADPLDMHIPICSSKDTNMNVTQYSMKPLEAVGMLKIDFLGLKTLTTIQKTVDMIESIEGNKIKWEDLPLDEPAAFDLLNQGKTLGIFQLESGGMRDLATRLHLDRFEEIIAVGALYRPGPMEMIPSFIARKHGKEKIEQEHPWMTDILAETYGIMVYQEQVMQIAQKLAGYSLGEGDLFRKAMGKKDKKEMGRQRKKFIQGCIEQNITEELAIQIFEKMERFASYGFNKSHAAAYGYLSYVTAYLKALYPKQWMAALMTCDRDDLNKIAKFISESDKLGIQILPPDVNESTTEFIAAKSGIRFAMSAIRGMGEGIVQLIVAERKNKGFFTSLHNFIDRMHTKIGRKAVHLLVQAGAFDFTSWPRESLLISIDPMFDSVERKAKEDEQGIISMFAAKEKNPFEKPPQLSKPEDVNTMLRLEKELLGFFLTGHPLKQWQENLESWECEPLEKALQTVGVKRTAFLIDDVQYKILSRSNRKFAIVTISDALERYEMPIWPEMTENVAPLLIEGKILMGVIAVEEVEPNLRLNCRFIAAIEDVTPEVLKEAAKQSFAIKARSKKEAPTKVEDPKPTEKLELAIDLKEAKMSQMLKIKTLFSKFAGKTPVDLVFRQNDQVEATIEISSSWGVNLEEEFFKRIEKIPAVYEHKVHDLKAE